MRLAAALVAALSGSLALGAPAQAQPGVVIGTLTCNVASGFGFVFGSSRAINCTFAGPGGRYEHYVGTSQNLALISASPRAASWCGPCCPNRRSGTGRACWHYVGGTASATVGVGVGANALVGGSSNSIALQPLSIEANRGLNVAAGVAAMTLTPAP